MKPLFITLEGIDGSGKTTQSEILKKNLEALGYDVLLTREPGGTEISNALRNILLNLEEKIDPMTEVLLYCASRNEHIERTIKPALKKGMIVISDRYYDSTVAYQGYGEAISIERIRNINDIFPVPDLTFIFTISEHTFNKRFEGQEKDSIEKKGFSFMEKVQNGYIHIYKQRHKQRNMELIDGNSGIIPIQNHILEKVIELIKNNK